MVVRITKNEWKRKEEEIYKSKGFLPLLEFYKEITLLGLSIYALEGSYLHLILWGMQK